MAGLRMFVTGAPVCPLHAARGGRGRQAQCAGRKAAGANDYLTLQRKYTMDCVVSQWVYYLFTKPREK